MECTPPSPGAASPPADFTCPASLECTEWKNAPGDRSKYCVSSGPNPCNGDFQKTECPPGADSKRFVRFGDKCLLDCYNAADDAPLPPKNCANKCKEADSSMNNRSTLTCSENPSWALHEQGKTNPRWACAHSTPTDMDSSQETCEGADASKFITCDDEKLVAKALYTTWGDGSSRCNFYCGEPDEGGGWLKWVIIIAVVVGVLLLLVMLMHRGGS